MLVSNVQLAGPNVQEGIGGQCPGPLAQEPPPPQKKKKRTRRFEGKLGIRKIKMEKGVTEHQPPPIFN